MNFPGWIEDAVAYQIFPDRFCSLGQYLDVQPWGSPPRNEGWMGGTLRGIESKLNYIRRIGCNLIYLNPIFPSPSNHRYDASDYFSVDPFLGSREDFDSLVSALHINRSRLMMDIAFNHTSNVNPRFLSALAGDNESRPWYFFVEGDSYEKEWVRLGGLSYKAWWGYPHMPKLNMGHLPVQTHHLDVLGFWSGRGVDAFRFDVPSDIENPYFWNRVADTSEGKLRIAELWWEQRDWLKENRMHGQMNYPLLYYLLNFFAYTEIKEEVLYSCGLGDGYFSDFSLRNRDMWVFLGSIDRLFAIGQGSDSLDYKLACSNLNVLGSHDIPRIASYLPNRDIRKQVFAFLFFSPGIPCIYYGDEVGMLGEKDPGNRGAFDWIKSNWDNEFLLYVKSLVHLRKFHPAFKGSFEIRDKHGLVELIRHSGSRRAIAVFNRFSHNLDYLPESNLSEIISGKGRVYKETPIIIPGHGARIFCT